MSSSGHFPVYFQQEYVSFKGMQDFEERIGWGQRLRRVENRQNFFERPLLLCRQAGLDFLTRIENGPICLFGFGEPSRPRRPRQQLVQRLGEAEQIGRANV